MKVRIIGSGTSTGVPQIGCTCPVCTSTDPKDNRLRASAIVETDDARILIDCGPDFRTQVLRLPFEKIDEMCIRDRVNEDQATYSLMKCGIQLAKEVPVVFGGVNYPNWGLLKRHPNVTGFHDKIAFNENISVAKELFGEHVRLFTMLDTCLLYTSRLFEYL